MEGRWRALTLASRAAKTMPTYASARHRLPLEPFSLGSRAAVSLGASSAEDGDGQRADLSLSLHANTVLMRPAMAGSPLQRLFPVALEELSPASLVNSAPLLSAQDLARRSQPKSGSCAFPTGLAALVSISSTLLPTLAWRLRRLMRPAPTRRFQAG